jgi:hypothetical protein
MIDRIKDEPALLAALVQAIVVLVIAFGVDLTTDQSAAIMGVTIAVTALLVRRVVTPNRKL